MNTIMPATYRFAARTSQCPSDWRVVRLAHDDVAATAAEDKHFADCAFCASRLQDERAARAEGMHMPVPRALLGQPKAPKRSWPVAALTAAACTLAAVLLVPHAPAALSHTGAPVDQVKGGGLDLTVSIVRNGTLIAQDVPAQPQQLQANDRVRVRVLGAAGAGFVRLESWEADGNWTSLYSGAVPGDGLLPLALDITAGETRMRLTVCDSPREDDCRQRDFLF